MAIKPADQTSEEEKKEGQEQTDATDKKEEKKEPLDVLEVVDYDPVTGEKKPYRKEVYSVDEYRALAQKGLSADAKWQAMPALIRKEAQTLAEQMVEPKAKEMAQQIVEQMQQTETKINEDTLAEGDPKEVAKAIKKALSGIQDLRDTYEADKLMNIEKETQKEKYNEKIGEVLQTYKNVKQEVLVPFVAKHFFPHHVPAEAIVGLGELLSALSDKGINLEELKPEDREKLEGAIVKKQKEKIPPPPEGDVVKKEKETGPPKDFDVLLEDFGQYFEQKT